MVSRHIGRQRTLGVLAFLGLLTFVLSWSITTTPPRVSLSVATAAETLVLGMVKDVNGNALGGATVRITEPSSGRKYEVKTGKTGEFTQVGLRAGDYTIVVSKEGVWKSEGNFKVRAVCVRLNVVLGVSASEGMTTAEACPEPTR